LDYPSAKKEIDQVVSIDPEFISSNEGQLTMALLEAVEQKDDVM
jgi:hypothetical protein